MESLVQKVARLEKEKTELESLIQEAESNESALASAEEKMKSIETLSNEIERIKTLQTKSATILEKKAESSVNSIPVEIKSNESKGNKENAGGEFFKYVIGRSKESKQKAEDYFGKDVFSTGSISGGSVFVPEAIASPIFTTMQNLSVFRSEAQILTGLENVTIPSVTQLGEGTWNAELSGMASTDQDKFLPINLRTKSLGASVPIQKKLLELNPQNVYQIIVDGLSAKLARSFETASFLGDGSSTFGGSIGYAEAFKRIYTDLGLAVTDSGGLRQASGNLWSEITLDDIEALQGLLPSTATQGVFYCSKAFYFQVMRNLALDAGLASLYLLPSNVSNLNQGSWCGIPVRFVDVMPSTQANSQIPLLYGSIAQTGAVLDLNSSIELLLDETTSASNLRNTLYGWMYTDLQIHNIGNASATADLRRAGAMVGLITQAS